MGLDVWRNKEEAEERVKRINKREKDFGEDTVFFVIKVEVVDPELLVGDFGGYWASKNIGDPLQDPFGVGEANREVFHKGDVGYFITTGKDIDGNPYDVAEVGL